MSHGPNIVTIGGGTGSFTLLSALKNYTSNITAIVNMVDDGGSTGALRDQYGVLPPGDVRQCLVALSDDQRIARDLFNYRFGEGNFEGHAFGNVFLSALEKVTGSFAEAVESASELLRITGTVLPVTLQDATLIAHLDDRDVVGEYEIAHMKTKQDFRTIEFSLTDGVVINPQAKEAILKADLVVICPGNLYGSLAPTLIVPGVGEALHKTDAPTVYVSNLVTKPGQTDNFSVDDFAQEIERFAGGEEILDYVLYNTLQPSKELLDAYADQDEYGVSADENTFLEAHYEAKGYPLLNEEIFAPHENDTLIARTLIRHDADAVCRQLMRIYYQ